MVSLRTSATWMFAIGLLMTAIGTFVHGPMDPAEADQGIWVPLHFVQTLGYFLLAAGALAYATDPLRPDLGRTAMVLFAFGAFLAAFVHVIDGSVRVTMMDAGLAEGDVLWDSVFGLATWPLVIGYLFIGAGGATTAWQISRDAVGVRRGFAVGGTVLYTIGGLAGLAEVVGGPLGLAWPMLGLAWLWHGVTLAAPRATAPATQAATA